MVEWLTYNYMWIKALHVIAMIAWMAGLFYLPRLFVYHTRVKQESESAKLFEVMEQKLLRIIMNPAMILTWVFGILLIYLNEPVMTQGWLHHKITFVIILSGFHGFLSATRKKFARGENTRSEKFYRYINEVPTVCLIIIVILAIVKPF